MTTCRSADMPTAMKNSPSNKPLNGSMFASSSWRYSESAKRTPARNEPRAIERPIFSIASAVPTTTKSAQADDSSWLLAEATMRNTGRSR